MPRNALIRSSKFPYHVRARSNNQEWFALDGNELWGIFTKLLAKITRDYDVLIHAFVLMSNHFHLVLSTPRANIDRAMQYLLRESTKSINRSSQRQNHVYGGPYQWSLIYDGLYYRNVLKYVFRNPVKAGMVQQVEAYPWSTIRPYLDETEPPSLLSTKSIFDTGVVPKLPLAWLNTPFTNEQNEALKRGLGHREFQIAKRYGIPFREVR